MTLREYIEHLDKLVSEDTSLLDYEVVQANDDEGNYYKSVFYKPSVVALDIDMEQCCDDEGDKYVCLN